MRLSMNIALLTALVSLCGPGFIPQAMAQGMPAQSATPTDGGAAMSMSGTPSEGICPMALAESQGTTAPLASAASGRQTGAGNGGRAAPRYVYSLDHEGSLGLLLGGFGTYRSMEKSGCPTCDTDEVASGWAGNLSVGVTLALGWEGAEFTLQFDMDRLTSYPGEEIALGLRHYFGKEEFKTFLSLEALGTIRPLGGGGIRGGFGVIWDFHPLFGVWGAARASIVVGQGRIFAAQFGAGIQIRSYLF